MASPSSLPTPARGVKAWAETLMKRPSTHSFPEREFEALYRLNVKNRNKYLSQFIADTAVAAE
jgi:glutathione S-transferase